MTQPRQKEISNSYLEHWLTHHEMGQPQFWVGKFHSAQESYNAADQQRLEAEGKYLIFANGKNCYFADAETASRFADAEKSGYFTGC